MNTLKLTSLVKLTLIALFFVGCCRSADDVWDDTKTAGRHMNRGFSVLGGKHGDSRQVSCREDFLQYQNDSCDEYCIEDCHATEFEPLADQDYSNEIALVDRKEATSQPQQEFSQSSAPIPGIEAFQDPKNNPALAEIFQNVHFPYNSSLIKGRDNMNTIRAVASYAKSNPGTYLFVEGHCDERGAEAYNLALGTRRCNAVRNLLIKEGVSSERIFNVSYGKERSLDLGHTEEAWAKNRRAEFKIYQR